MLAVLQRLRIPVNEDSFNRENGYVPVFQSPLTGITWPHGLIVNISAEQTSGTLPLSQLCAMGTHLATS